MWDYTLIEWTCNTDGGVTGVVLECANGDRQYLTLEEYAKFTNNRDNNNGRKSCNSKG